MHSNKSGFPQHTGVRRRIIVIEETFPAPAALRQVVAFCPHHALPLPMRLQEIDLTPEGQAVALYRCSERHCGYQQHWIQDPRTGKPRPYQKPQPRLPRPEDFSF